MKKTKQLFASLMILLSGLGTLQAEECPSRIMEGNVCLPKGFPVEPTPGSYGLNLPIGQTQLSADVYDLHMLILWICVFIGIGVFGTMFYSIYHHRKSKGHVAEQFHENTTVEIIWTIIPAVILIAMAIPATKTLMEMDDVQDSDMTVKVTGWQWKWEYEYQDSGIHLWSNLDEASNRARQLKSHIDTRSIPHYLLRVDEPLVVPVGKKIRFVFTAADVQHSWWVPDLGWKKDAIPGFINEAWTSVAKPGIYRGQCTELCGKDHAFMPVVVIAMEQNDYDGWKKGKLDKQAQSNDVADLTHDELMKKGIEIYAKNCATCHMEDGSGVPGAFPALKGSAVVNGDINAQASLILNGKNAMPAFGKQLSSAELAAVITYTRNALGNSKGDEIQPKDIKVLLDGGTASPSPAKSETESAPEKPQANKASPVVKQDGSKKTDAKSPVTQDKAVKTTAGSGAEKTLEQLITQGETVYQGKCQSCHQKDGAGMPPTFPALKASGVVTGDIGAQVELMLKGKGMMPAFGKTLNAEEFAAVLAYTRNKLGNSVGDYKKVSEIEKLQAGL